MKGGHRHYRNYWFCQICGKALKVGQFNKYYSYTSRRKRLQHMVTVHQVKWTIPTKKEMDD